NRYEIIAVFLALLELIRLKVVLIKQHDTFGEIEITRKSSTAVNLT
ncbi:MAG: segregation/condensation protein A, partial [Candidatus Omnitrophica bacterium]|nr:segregation/condensation protein A [Candidatus Omnitrophota bacterium]